MRSATRRPAVFSKSSTLRTSARKCRGKCGARIKVSVWMVINRGSSVTSLFLTKADWKSLRIRVRSRPAMSDKTAATNRSTRNQRESVPVVTVESFYNSHAEKLQIKLEGPLVGFHRKIREPTINRPGLALSGFYTYFAEKRVQVLG